METKWLTIFVSSCRSASSTKKPLTDALQKVRELLGSVRYGFTGCGEEFGGGKEGGEGVASLPNRLSTSSFPIHEGQHAEYGDLMTFENLDCLQRAGSGGECVFNHHDWHPVRQATLNPKSYPVAFRAFSNSKSPNRISLEPTSVGDGIGDWVCPEGETADPMSFGLTLSKGFEPQSSHEELTFGRHRGSPAIEVIGRTGPTG